MLHPGAAEMTTRVDAESPITANGHRERSSTALATQREIELADRYLAHNYAPVPVVAARAEGAWITDVEGRRYLDCLAAYSAVNFGHRNPQLVAVAHAQLDTLTLTSRAFHSDRLGTFAAELAQLAGKEMVLPMNTGAEAVESALKVARKWGAAVKCVPTNSASVIVANGNFHGRTITIVSFSDDPDARKDFGPFTPGFRMAPYASAQAIEALLDDTTVAVLLEPIQGEAGVLVPPDDYLPAVRELCTRRGVLLICDEIQSGLGRTGYTFASSHWGVVPDMYCLGKALGGGLVPVSAVVANRNVLGVLRPGQHGSTFGGNPLAAAIGTQVVRMLATGEWQERARVLGERLHRDLRDLVGHGVTAVRGLGLWAGVDVDPSLGTGAEVCRRLAERGVLAKDAHGHTLRLAPPLVITPDEIDWAVEQLRATLDSIG
jgi:ornithine--oxo-acid transaminase